MLKKLHLRDCQSSIRWFNEVRQSQHLILLLNFIPIRLR